LINLSHLYLSDNHLSGQIPINICNQGDSSPDLENNYLCPPYPDCLDEDDIGYQDILDCIECSNGDINGDLLLDILDIVIVVTMIVDEQEYSHCADMNLDNFIDILDIVLMVNVVLDN